MTDNSTSAMLLPNPLTPLAFLPPTLADEFQVTSYVYVGSLGAFLWDWLMSMPEEYIILRKGSFTLSKVAYLLARISTLAFCVATTMFQVASIHNCQSLLYTIGAFATLEIITNSFLFFLRVRAVYGNSRTITAIFGVLWLAVISTSLLVPFGLDAVHLGPTMRCVNTNIRSWVVAPMVAVAVNNTVVFVAISCRICSQSMHGDGWRSQAVSFFRGDGVPRVARDFLHAGQLYYFVTTVMVVAQMVLAFGPVYGSVLSVPAVALENAMTCRVYRAAVLGFVTDGTRGGPTGPCILTTVLSGIGSSGEVALKEHRLWGPRRELAPAPSDGGHAEKIADRV